MAFSFETHETENLTSIALLDRQGIIIEVNEAWRSIADANAFKQPNHGIGLDYLGVCRKADGPQAKGAREAADGIEAVLNGTRSDYLCEYSFTPPSSAAWTKPQWFLMLVTSIEIGGEKGAQVAHIPITGRKETELELRRNEKLFSSIVQQAAEAVVLTDIDGHILMFNRRAEKAFGYHAEDAIGMHFSALVPERFREVHQEHFGKFLDDPAPSRSFGLRPEVVGLRKDGTEFPALASLAKVALEDRMILSVMLHDRSETRGLEERLHQAQKMEAVGQLTGGIAHDFNNLLSVVLGNAELLEDQLGDSDPSLNAVRSAARRGAALTQRLLAFSRQQPLRPKSLDLGALIEGLSDMVSRTLGETIDVQIKAAAGVWPAWADANQVENALLNLAINARDAMPEGGRLTIECDNIALSESYAARNPDARPGDFVVLAVSDSGMGMSEEVRARVFEPFFTTKEVGVGTGLGLSMVYGFAKQSGGHVTIYSERHRGTTVKLYLPRADSTMGQAVDTTQDQIPKGKGETILVIEDDRDVRDLTKKTLHVLGYRPIVAHDAASARALVAEGTKIDLVLSDVVLPGGVSGPAFVSEIQASHPALPVVFTSGYTAEAAVRAGLISSGHILINKPFQRQQLARTLHRALTQSAE